MIGFVRTTVLLFWRNPQECVRVELLLPEMFALAIANPDPAFVALWAFTRVLILLFVLGAAQHAWHAHRRVVAVLARRSEVIARLRAQSLY
jgi:hypothetical protein